MPVGDGSLTEMTQCVLPAAFCAAVGGQYAFAFDPILPSCTVKANAGTPPVAFDPPGTPLGVVHPLPSCGMAGSPLHSSTTRKASLFLNVPDGADTWTDCPSFSDECGVTVSGFVSLAAFGCAAEYRPAAATAAFTSLVSAVPSPCLRVAAEEGAVLAPMMSPVVRTVATPAAAKRAMRRLFDTTTGLPGSPLRSAARPSIRSIALRGGARSRFGDTSRYAGKPGYAADLPLSQA
jgi:hypothetical protein